MFFSLTYVAANGWGYATLGKSKPLSYQHSQSYKKDVHLT